MSASGYDPPRLELGPVALRPISTHDYANLRVAELSESLGPRWRYSGNTPTMEQWVSTLGQGILAQFLIVSQGDGRALGIVCAYNADLANGFAYVALADFATASHTSLTMLGGAIFVDYVFKIWNLRKLYIDTIEFNLEQFSSGIGRLFTIEGRLKEHRYYDGQYWDQYILSIARDSWVAERHRLMPDST
jgi:hypothetical protein